MKLRITVVSVLCVALSYAYAADSLKPAGSASAPGLLAPSPSRKIPPKGVSAADAANNAQEPGKVRPEHEVVPQIVVPLRARRVDDAQGRGGEIDQEAARCAAQKTKSQRQICMEKKK